MLNEAEQPEAVRQVMDVRIAIKENGVQVFRGPLRDSASVSFEKHHTSFQCHSDSGRLAPLFK
jgi:hypothetical protein